jgi:hypothetical protein
MRVYEGGVTLSPPHQRENARAWGVCTKVRFGHFFHNFNAKTDLQRLGPGH